MSAGHYLKTLRENRISGTCATCTVASSDAPDSVKMIADYVCDGTDDHVELQSAVDSLTALGGKIYLTEGIYNIGDVIDVQVPVDWHGVGGGEHWAGSAPYGYYSTILSANVGLASKIMYIHGNHYAGAFYDIGFSGANMSQVVLAASASAVDIDNLGDFLISHCFFLNLPFATPLHVHNHGSWIVGCDFEYCRLTTTGAVYLQDHRNWIDRCYFANNRSGVEIGTGEVSISNCVFRDSDRYHVAHNALEKVAITNCRFRTWNKDVAAWDAIRFHSDSTVHTLITNNIFDGDSCGVTRGVSDGGKTIDYISILDNNFHGFGATPPVLMTTAGSNCVVRNNIGYVTENSGTDTLPAASTSVAVTHGLSVTPSVGDITVVPIEAWGNMTQFYIDTYTATQFTIHADVAPGADTDFAWAAIVL